MSWDPIEISREARRAARLQPPTKKGDRIAWTLHGFAGLTEGLSEIHRVYDDTMVYCEEEMPDQLLTIAPLRTLETCPYCKARHDSGWEKTDEEPDTNASDLARSVE